MAADMSLVLEGLRRELEGVPERCPGYRKELRATLADVVGLEREHQELKIAIVKKITEKSEVLARYVASKTAAEG